MRFFLIELFSDDPLKSDFIGFSSGDVVVYFLNLNVKKLRLAIKRSMIWHRKCLVFFFSGENKIFSKIRIEDWSDIRWEFSFNTLHFVKFDVRKRIFSLRGLIFDADGL